MNKYLENLNKEKILVDLNSLEEYARENDVPIIEFDSLMVLKTIIKIKNVKSILEIGCAIGYSSIAMASFDEQIVIDTIERDSKMYEIALENVKKYKKENQINIHFVDALEIDCKELRNSYDLIFIDAAKAQSIKFFEKFSPLLNKDGVIVTDNLLFHGCVENKEGLSKNLYKMVEKIDTYNHYLNGLQEYDTTFVATGDGLGVTCRKK